MANVRIFKNTWFSRFARHEGISDRDLCDAVGRAERGLIDANLGGGVIKQRIPRPNEGRSGGFRSIVLFRVGERAFFVYGFAKNRMDNISDDNLKAFRLVANTYLNHDDNQIQELLNLEELIEVSCNDKDL